MTESASRKFSDTLRRKASGAEAEEAKPGAVPIELLERAAEALAEMQGVLEEMAALGAEGEDDTETEATQ